MSDLNLEHSELTDKIIRAFYNVYNELGYGFLEKVYENAMLVEMKDLGLSVEHQCPIEVYYSGVAVGSYTADIIVEGKVIVELKAAETLRVEHECQLINYLRATDLTVGLLLNFGRKPSFKRKVWSNLNNQFITDKILNP